MPPSYATRIQSIERCGADVVLATLDLPDGYSFRAGQWFRLTLRTPIGPEAKTLSHAAAPSDGVVAFATRLSTTVYKQSLALLKEGDGVEISAPGGRLSLPEPDVRLGFLAGGVGITPIRSLLRESLATKRQLLDPVLLYGNRDESCIPFRGELEGMSEKGIKTVHVLERAPEGWEQETGFITADMISRHMPPEDRTFIVSGPPVMVTAMERVLDEVGVPAERRIIESFGPRTVVRT